MPNEPEPIVFNYAVVDMTQSDNMPEELCDLPDGRTAISLGPDVILQVDSISISKMIGYLQAIQHIRNMNTVERHYRREHGIEGPEL